MPTTILFWKWKYLAISIKVYEVTEQSFSFAPASSFSFNGKLLEQIATWLWFYTEASYISLIIWFFKKYWHGDPL
jgi:hypothetical protein